ncbi:hypothetical protein MCUN1_002855 [Malassezia cuniculi]|uniref:Myb-like domain-containing protein n=1 Tax=Malassezia cuniculi TaxID=948313 RepID=A0AAF0J7R6_9BASI|nr:hypothetical protein MCUN1_002855 [Malassezia cuniculi]
MPVRRVVPISDGRQGADKDAESRETAQPAQPAAPAHQQHESATQAEVTNEPTQPKARQIEPTRPTVRSHSAASIQPSQQQPGVPIQAPAPLNNTEISAPVKPSFSPAEPISQPETRRRTRNSSNPRRRPAATISDDEAEYNAQVAQDGSGDNGLPPLKVDVGSTRMESIAVNNWRSGRASSRTFELERVRARQLKKRRANEDDASGRESSVAPPVKDSSTPVPDGHDNDSEDYGDNRFAVQTRIVDGKIVLDEQSLFANYRDDEQQDREQRNWEVIDEREGDQFINSASRGKQRRTQRWTAEETERFFQAVSQWGTDFEMITRLFPRRTRREIKSKWTKESRHNSRRLDEAFRRRVKVDLKAYGNAVGVDLSGPPPVIVPKMPESEIKSSQTAEDAALSEAVDSSNADPSVVEEIGNVM